MDEEKRLVKEEAKTLLNTLLHLGNLGAWKAELGDKWETTLNETFDKVADFARENGFGEVMDEIG